MKKTSIAALGLLSLAGTALAAPRETQTIAGPVEVHGSDDGQPAAANTTVSATFTATGYNAIGIRASIAVEFVDFFTFVTDLTVHCIPPVGEPFDIFFSDTLLTDFDTFSNLTTTWPLPEGVQAAGTWQFIVWDSFWDSQDETPDALASNLRFSLDSDEPPVTVHDFGTVTGIDATATINDYAGDDVVWLKVTVPQDADDVTGFWMDLNTVGSVTGEGYITAANDTELGLFRADGTIVDINDDINFDEDILASALTFGATTPRDHGGDGATYDGSGGTLTAGTYYIAAGTFELAFFQGLPFNVDAASDSTGGTLVVNVFSNFTGGPTACSPADLGVAGGETGQDRLLDNNDFISFITLFFAQDAAADLGVAGGLPGQDSAWDNNDFIAFINFFFDDAASCTG